MDFKRIGIASGIALSLALSGAAAHAAIITETVSFTATGFGQDAPVDPVSGSFTFTFDPTLDFPNNTPGVTVNDLNLPISGNAEFSYAKAPNLPEGELSIILGNGQCLAAGCFELDFATPANAFFSGNGSGVFTGDDFAFYDAPTLGGEQFQASTGTYTVTSGAVPEPATWAVIVVGFGGIGAALRGSRRRQSFVAA